MEAKDTVMKDRGAGYDANCGQIIACDILPRYVIGSNQREPCYLEISKVVEEFVESERKAQAEISFKAGYKKALEGAVIEGGYESVKKVGIREVVEWMDKHDVIGFCYDADEETQRQYMIEWSTKLKDWGIDEYI